MRLFNNRSQNHSIRLLNDLPTVEQLAIIFWLSTWGESDYDFIHNGFGFSRFWFRTFFHFDSQNFDYDSEPRQELWFQFEFQNCDSDSNDSDYVSLPGLSIPVGSNNSDFDSENSDFDAIENDSDADDLFLAAAGEIWFQSENSDFDAIDFDADSGILMPVPFWF